MYIYIYILKNLALLQSSDFGIYIAAWSAPVQDGIQVFTGSVDLVLSAGVTQLVFGRVPTALKMYPLHGN